MGLRGRNILSEETFFFTTTTVVKFLNVFKYDAACDLLIKNMKYYQMNCKYNILGYVIMPSHFHWILQIDPNYGTISDIMRDLKKYSAWDIMEFFRGEDKYVNVFRNEAKNLIDQDRKFWMKRFDDKVIRNKNQFYRTLTYIHNNPIVEGLVNKAEDYKYSSARNYLLDDHSVIYVNTNVVGY